MMYNVEVLKPGADQVYGSQGVQMAYRCYRMPCYNNCKIILLLEYLYNYIIIIFIYLFM